ncbi:MAG: protein kinase, partial [Candidatus Sumerlaeaceae bacterium]|nr:protein kinase [Candidatus Sumerlaeaceae bacterium]
LQGEGEKSYENRSLGKFALSGLQRAPAGVPRIQVTFHINANGMVEVSAEDLVTRESKTVSVTLQADDESSGGRRRVAARSESRWRRARSQSASTSEVIAARGGGAVSGRERISMLRVKDASGEFEPVRPGGETALESHALDLKADRPHTAAPVVPGTPLPSSPAPAGAAPTDDLDSVPTERLGVGAQVGDSSAKARPPVPPETGMVAQLSTVARDALKRMQEGSPLSPESLEKFRDAATELANFAAGNLEQTAVVESALRLLTFVGDQAGARTLLAKALESPATSTALATAMFNHYLSFHPDDEFALAGRAELALREGKTDQALEDYERLCADDRGTDTQVEKLVDLYQAKLASANHEDPETQFKLVKLLLRRNRVDEAINLLQRLARSEPYKARALKILGLCLWQKGMHYLAWQKFQQLPLTEEVKDILLRLSSDMENTDQYLNAKCVLEHLHENDPSYRDVKDRLARVERLVAQQAESAGHSAQPSSVFVAFRDSRFIILEEINRGSMGIVYRAKDKILDEPVALKVLTDYLTSDPSAVERFKREARAAKRLSHPNIVRIHDMFEIGNKKLLSMEYINGKDLKKILLERRTLPVKEIVSIVRSVCDALAYAHKQGIVHRDIKPANIMITHDGQVKVTDFGIAKFLLATADSTRSGSQILGTPLYMSPEQIRGDQVDERSDIYSLGAMLYEMISGRPPFWEGNIEYHHLHTAPTPLDESVSPALASIVLKCLAKAPADRFQSIEELSVALMGVE